eukprot:gene31418-40452_t
MTGKAEEREDRLAAAAAAAAANVVVSVTAADDAVGIGSGGTSAEPGSSGVVSLRSSSLAAIPMAVVVAVGPAFLFSEKLDFRRYLLNSLSAAEGCRDRVGSCAVEGDGSGIVLLAGKKELVMVPTPQMLLEEPVLCLAALFLE